MAYQFSIVLQSSSRSILDRLSLYLMRETRPLFEEDVPDEDIQIFRAMDELEYPTYVEVREDKLWVSWSEQDGFGIEEVKSLLGLKGVDFILAYEVPDDPMAGDDESDESWYWVPVGENIKRANKSVALKLCPEDIVCAFDNDV